MASRKTEERAQTQYEQKVKEEEVVGKKKKRVWLTLRGGSGTGILWVGGTLAGAEAPVVDSNLDPLLGTQEDTCTSGPSSPGFRAELGKDIVAKEIGRFSATCSLPGEPRKVFP